MKKQKTILCISIWLLLCSFAYTHFQFKSVRTYPQLNGNVRSVSYEKYAAVVKFGEVERGERDTYWLDKDFYREACGGPEMSKLALDESTYFGFEHHGLSLYNKNFIEKYSRENQRKDSIELSADLKGVFEYDVDGNCTGGSVQWLTKVKKQHEIGDKKWSYDCIYNKISAGDNPSDVVYGGGGKTVLVEKNVWTYEAVTQVKTLLHKIKYKYTEEGLLSQRDEYNGDGSLFITDKYSYDEDGRIETITNIYGTIITKREYLFIDGQLFQVKINADAVEYFEFDERGNCTRSGEYLYEYKYDAKGNWTEMEAGYVTPGTAYKDHRKTVSHLIVRDIAYW